MKISSLKIASRRLSALGEHICRMHSLDNIFEYMLSDAQNVLQFRLEIFIFGVGIHQNRLQNAIGSLSSGKSLNTAKDAPADVYQSDVLKSKVHGLGQASDNVENSISLLQSAQSH